MLQDEQYDNQWYIDSGCSRHMTGKLEYLKDFCGLQGAGYVKFGNKDLAEIKGYGKITNGDFTINKVAYCHTPNQDLGGRVWGRVTDWYQSHWL